MTTKSRRKLRTALTSNDIVEALAEKIQVNTGIDHKVNAMRAFLGKRPLKGLVELTMAEKQTTVEFKAALFDSFFSFYGPRLPSALRSFNKQVRTLPLGALAGAKKNREMGKLVADGYRDFAKQLLKQAPNLSQEELAARCVSRRPPSLPERSVSTVEKYLVHMRRGGATRE